MEFLTFYISSIVVVTAASPFWVFGKVTEAIVTFVSDFNGVEPRFYDEFMDDHD